MLRSTSGTIVYTRDGVLPNTGSFSYYKVSSLITCIYSWLCTGPNCALSLKSMRNYLNNNVGELG